MRKALVATIAMLLVSAGVWGVAKSQRITPIPIQR